MIRSTLRTLVACLPLVTPASPVHAETTVSFGQLNWDGIGLTVPDSTMGLVTIDFLGPATTEFFNLNVGGEWIVQNMTIEGLEGVGMPQSVSTPFDLGVTNGTDVTMIDAQFTLDPSPRTTMPTGSLMSELVVDQDYGAGGLGAGTLDDLNLFPDNGGAAAGGGSGGEGDDNGPRTARLPEVDMFIRDHNQALGRNDCLRGSVSNSLNYLKMRHRIPQGVPSTIDDMHGLFGNTSPGEQTPEEINGRPFDWARKKQATRPYRNVLRTQTVDVRSDTAGNQSFQQEDYDRLFEAIMRGYDVEVELHNHAMHLIGIRQREDGVVELEVLDDNQRTAGADAPKIYRIGTHREHENDQRMVLLRTPYIIQRFVIESPARPRRPGRQRQSGQGQSRGNSVLFDAISQTLSFAGDFIVDTGHAGDPLLGAEVLAPLFQLTSFDAAEGLAHFERLTSDPFVLARAGEEFLTSQIATLSYDVSTNEFFGTLFDVRLAGADPTSPLFDPTLSPLHSGLLDEFGAVLDPDSVDYDADSLLYFTFRSDEDFLTATNQFTQFAEEAGTNFMFMAHAVPEPTTAAIGIGMLAAIGGGRTRRRWEAV